ncbi:hypothetical protein AB1Y20_016912 [Prymnesium parvum]|uniref:Methyltransferase FkbM domain-containing protein n=1 Tax=Prymnesium parvum TaxID=97485 RepID=A0AB34ICA0_PRYPA
MARHPACGGAPRVRPPHLCGDPELFNRSYPLLGRWPFATLPFVMELRAPGSCDLYQSIKTCCRFSDGLLADPERHVREAIAALLIRCPTRPRERPCLAVDLGANNGWFTALMLQLSAHVVAVEPQPDLAAALAQTVALNCWSHRAVLLHARACADADAACLAPTDASRCVLGFRLSYPRAAPEDCASRLGVPRAVGGVSLETIFFHSHPAAAAAAARGATVEVDLAKLDADGPEGAWLGALDGFIGAGRLRLRGLQIEGSHLDAELMRRFQSVHGYECYRLDWLDGRRWITGEGWDAYSPEGTFAPLSRHREAHARIGRTRMKYSPKGFSRLRAMRNHSRDDFEEELFSIRGMRHVFRVKRNLSAEAWTLLLQPVALHGWPPQWLLTLEHDFVEPSFESIPCAQSPECTAARRGHEGLLSARHAKRREGAPLGAE